MSVRNNFQITPLDYLVIVIALIIAVVAEGGGIDKSVTWMALQMIVLFYASEFILQQVETIKKRFLGAIIAMLALLAVRGLI